MMHQPRPFFYSAHGKGALATCAAQYPLSVFLFFFFLPTLSD